MRDTYRDFEGLSLYGSTPVQPACSQGFGETAEFDENKSYVFLQGVWAAISPWEEMVLGMQGQGTEPSVS